MKDRGLARWKTVRRIILELFAAAVLTSLIAILAYRFHARALILKEMSFEDILAVLAIWFAIVHFVDSRNQEREINRVAQSMPTRFVGLFPKNLTEIVRVLSEAQRHIYIIVDYVGYAQYSSPRVYARYIETLKDAAGRGVTVRIACYDDPLADKEMVVQFPDGDEEFKKESSSARFQEYFAFKRGVARPTTMQGLRKLLDEHEKAHIEALRDQGAEICYLAEQPDFFLWLEDDEEAIFCFQNMEGAEERGFSFRTRDGNLIRQLKRVFDQRWSSCKRPATQPA